MNPEIRAQWTEALRSGLFAQGTGRLAAKQGGTMAYCCLGVLCELAVGAKVIEPSTVDYQSDGYTHAYGEDTATLPAKVADWAGLVFGNDEPNSVGEFWNDNTRAHSSLTELNDGGMAFWRIADVIEEHF